MTGSAQAAAQAQLNLRPLPMGELLDRAFHLYFKHFTLFIALLAVVLVPYTIIGYFQSRDALDAMFAVFAQVIHAPHGAPPSPATIEKLSRLNGINGLFGLQMAIAIIALPLANAAVVVAVSRAYLGLSVRFADSYRAAVGRWLSILILIVLWLAIAVMGAVAFFIIVIVVAAIMGLLTAALHASAVMGMLTVIMMIAVTLAFIALGAMLYLTLAFSFVAIILERIDPIKAFAGAFSRVFGAQQVWRSVTLALSLFLIQLALTLVGYASGGLLAYFLKSPALYVVFLSLINLFYAPFALLAVAVFYYDIRIRREGFDLQMLADQLAAVQAATPSSPA